MAVFIFLAYEEWRGTKTIQAVLDEKIPIEDMALEETGYITDKNGTVISELYSNENRIILADKDIPSFLKELFIVIEDQHFYEHTGFDAAAISRALIINSQNDSIEQGASTITQQLARNAYLTQDKTYNRKVTELLYAYQIEQSYDKNTILNLYINAIYFNNGAYGIEAASQVYFSKPTKKLTKAELAFLAAIPNSPERYNPLKHFDATKKRQERILKQMKDEGLLPAKEYKQLVQEKINLKTRTRIDQYPDYVSYVHQELKQLIAASEGLTKKLNSKNETTRKNAQKLLEDKTTQLLHSGITIHTALDPTIQNQAKQALNNGIHQADIEGATVVIQHHTHKLVSLIGGKNYKKNSFNRAYQGFRQPGSAIKPLLVYGPYFEKTNASLLSQVSGAGYCKDGYCPQNYGGANYGMVTLKRAFAQSYNTPAIRLLEQAGIEYSFHYLEKFKFSKLVKEDYRLAAGVGGFTYGMSPLELTQAYTSFHNGDYQPARAINKVTDRNGKTIYKWKDEPQEIWSTATLSKMRELLHEVTTSGTGRKGYFPTEYIGGKTGTTNDVRDIWFVGLTKDYTTGVWIGKDKPASLQSIYNSSPHVTIWKNISQQAQQ